MKVISKHKTIFKVMIEWLHYDTSEYFNVVFHTWSDKNDIYEQIHIYVLSLAFFWQVPNLKEI